VDERRVPKEAVPRPSQGDKAVAFCREGDSPLHTPGNEGAQQPWRTGSRGADGIPLLSVTWKSNDMHNQQDQQTKMFHDL
jgi:hypothetical protein